MSVNKFMQLWEYGYFVVQELDNVYTKLWDSRGTWLEWAQQPMNKVRYSYSYKGIDVIDITKDYKVFNVLKYCQLPFFQEQSICLEYSQ
jgi:hypothetical protein